jgi:YfiH family protein
MPEFSEADYLTSPLLQAAGFRHAFFTRRGGVSEAAYRSLNFSTAVGDTASNVAQNLERGARALGVDAGRIHFLSQVHGCAVHLLTERYDRAATLALEGDALVALAGRLACGVRSADCVPILLGDRKSGAVCAVHAGWRGMVHGVLETAVETLRAAIGGQGELVAAVGPHISVEAFEVSPDVGRELLAASFDPEVLRQRDGKVYVDLRRIARSKLLRLGLSERDVDDVWGCTVGDSERFFSYRRDGARSGRLLSAIVPRN